MKRDFPDRIVLLKGNHEANYAISCYPYEFEWEVENAYPGMHEKYVEVFKNMPLMVLSNKIFASHGGILKGFGLRELRKIDKNDLHAIESLTWSDPDVSRTLRGLGFHYSRDDVNEFLDGLMANLFVKGHDYTTNGTAIYGRRCLTIFSSRRYEKAGNGGVLLMESTKPAKMIEDVKLKSYSGKKWEEYRVKIV